MNNQDPMDETGAFRVERGRSKWVFLRAGDVEVLLWSLSKARVIEQIPSYLNGGCGTVTILNGSGQVTEIREYRQIPQQDVAAQESPVFDTSPSVVDRSEQAELERYRVWIRGGKWVFERLSDGQIIFWMLAQSRMNVEVAKFMRSRTGIVEHFRRTGELSRTDTYPCNLGIFWTQGNRSQPISE